MSDTVKTPTKEELIDLLDDDKSVLREVDDSWRHGSHIRQVLHRETDDTYWAVNYSLSTDGETHGLRDGDYRIKQVDRVEETVVQVNYKPIVRNKNGK